jgi:dTMP kinase
MLQDMKNNAPFIVVDGPEGAGKSSLLLKIKAFFGERIIITREPGGSPSAEKIREYIFAHPELTALEQFDKFWEARQLHLKETIIPALSSGVGVISDRFDSSTFGYQIRAKQAPELEELFWKYRNDFLVVPRLEPDLYVFLDLDIKIGLARKAQQKNVQLNHFDNWPVDLHERMRKGFKEFFVHVPHVIIDASRPEDEVFNDFVAVLENHFEWYKVGVAA